MTRFHANPELWPVGALVLALALGWIAWQAFKAIRRWSKDDD